MLEVDKLVAEIDAHQKDHVTLCDRLKALQEKVCLLSYLFTYILTYLVLLLLLLWDPVVHFFCTCAVVVGLSRRHDGSPDHR